MNKKLETILTVLLWLIALALTAQEQRQFTFRKTPTVAIESNLLYDLTGSLNVGAEMKLGQHSTLLLPIQYNPFALNEGTRKWKHILIQPEYRYWLCNPFAGHFFGAHAHYAFYNVAGVGPTWMQTRRFQGWLAGGGLSYGYQFYLSSRFNLEASVGAGYAYLDFDVHDCGTCGRFQSHDNKHYFGPTKAAISLIYIIK